jgi:hypothetical protein
VSCPYCWLGKPKCPVIAEPCYALAPDCQRFGRARVPVCPVSGCGHAVLDCVWLVGRCMLVLSLVVAPTVSETKLKKIGCQACE